MRAYLRHIGELQGRILLSIAYFLIVGPVWILMRVTRTRLLETGDQGWHAGRGRASSSAMEMPF